MADAAVLIARLRPRVRAALDEIGTEMVSHTKALMAHAPRGGRMYRRRRGSRVIEHKASAPGEPPAVDQGTLIGSVDYAIADEGTSMTLVFGSRLSPEIPDSLENGTKTIKPRPAFIPGYLMTKGTISRLFPGGGGITVSFPMTERRIDALGG